MDKIQTVVVIATVTLLLVLGSITLSDTAKQFVLSLF